MNDENFQSVAARRIKELRDEFESGQRQLAQLEERAKALRDTLQRIAGAIQVLEEITSGTTAGAD